MSRPGHIRTVFFPQKTVWMVRSRSDIVPASAADFHGKTHRDAGGGAFFQRLWAACNGNRGQPAIAAAHRQPRSLEAAGAAMPAGSPK